MPNWTIRAATKTDHPRIHQMSAAIQEHERAVVGYPMLPASEVAREFSDELLRHYPKANGEALVVEMDGEIVAYAIGFMGHKEDKLVDAAFHDYALLADLYVEPHARKLGIATALIAHFSHAMKAKGCNWLRLWAKAKNHDAVSTYLKNGFEAYDSSFVKKI